MALEYKELSFVNLSIAGKRVARTMLAFTLSFVALGARAEAPSYHWGPPIGQPLPVLDAPDHSGAPRSFDNLRGPRGLLLFMNRSTDW